MTSIEVTHIPFEYILGTVDGVNYVIYPWRVK